VLSAVWLSPSPPYTSFSINKCNFSGIVALVLHIPRQNNG
jgi:hypothetical protein